MGLPRSSLCFELIISYSLKRSTSVLSILKQFFTPAFSHGSLRPKAVQAAFFPTSPFLSGPQVEHTSAAWALGAVAGPSAFCEFVRCLTSLERGQVSCEGPQTEPTDRKQAGRRGPQVHAVPLFHWGSAAVICPLPGRRFFVRRIYRPKYLAIAFMRSAWATWKGQRLSQWPQEMQSEACFSSLA